MKHLKLFESFENDPWGSKIHEICYRYNIENYTINSDGSIDVDGNVNLHHKELKKLPLKFNKVNGYFDCYTNKLTSLEGCPIEINGAFFCYDNRLKSFKYSPKIIRGNFACNYNKINSFEYFPIHVGNHFWCISNPILQVWNLFIDIEKIELLNDFDIFRDEDTDEPAIIMDRLNDFLLTIGKKTVEKVDGYKNI